MLPNAASPLEVLTKLVVPVIAGGFVVEALVGAVGLTRSIGVPPVRAFWGRTKVVPDGKLLLLRSWPFSVETVFGVKSKQFVFLL